MDFQWFSMDSQWSCYCFLEVFGSAWGAPVPKRAQRASEASARSDSARAVVKSRRPGESYAALLGGVFCGLLNFQTRFPFYADSGFFFHVFGSFFVVFSGSFF